MNLIDSKNCFTIIIDVQEKLVNMLNDNTVKDNAVKISKAAGILKISTIITEQYPKGLGETIPEIKSALPYAKYVEKTSFSAFNEACFKELLPENKNQIIIFGIETHICVLQTSIDLISNGYEVFIVKNACGSRNESEKPAAFERLMNAGATIVTVEQVLFEWLKSSKHPNFKEIQSLIK